MGKRAKGLDLVKQQNAVKKSMLVSCKKYAEQLEAENYALKNDPNTVIGQFIGQFKELYGQNSRLSVLCACLLTKLEDKVVLTKDEMEAFKQKRINIKWEIADGETVETAKEFTFTYELQDAPPQGQPVQQTEQPGECNDPDCTLPKDLKHTHTTPVAVTQDAVIAGEPATEVTPTDDVEDAELCTDPDCTAAEMGEHIHVVEDAEEVSTE
jgi:hypothetical protein